MKNFPEPFKCGLEELDFQHEEITQFLKVITEVPTLENLKTLFRFLVDHFLLEESLLKGIMEEKSAYQGHVLFHDGILSELDQLIRRYGHENIRQRFADFLVWLEKNDHWDERYLKKLRDDPDLMNKTQRIVKDSIDSLIAPSHYIDESGLLAFYQEVSPR